MNSKQFWENHAIEFIGRDSWENSKDFKSKLDMELLDINEDSDKLIFLYKCLSEQDRKHKDEHLPYCRYGGNDKMCIQCNANSKERFYSEQEIRSIYPAYGLEAVAPDIDTALIQHNLLDLSAFLGASTLLQSALEHLNNSNTRNALDDLRLCIETLLREKLNNDKNLKNQLPEISTHFEKAGISSYVSNMFRTLLDYFDKYNNEYIKHNNNVRDTEIEFIINLSSTFIRLIVKV